MVRLAVVLLAGATFVAAQTTETEDVSTTTEEVTVTAERVQKGRMNADSASQVMDQLKEKLGDAIKCDSGSFGRAREAAMEMRDQMREQDGECDSLMEQRRAETHDRIQGAIEAMEKRGDKVGAQVQEVRERIQTRITEKRQELVDLQQKILERQEARKAEREAKVEDATTTDESATEDAAEETVGQRGRTGKPTVEEATEEAVEETTAE